MSTTFVGDHNIVIHRANILTKDGLILKFVQIHESPNSFQAIGIVVFQLHSAMTCPCGWTASNDEVVCASLSAMPCIGD